MNFSDITSEEIKPTVFWNYIESEGCPYGNKYACSLYACSVRRRSTEQQVKSSSFLMDTGWTSEYGATVAWTESILYY